MILSRVGYTWHGATLSRQRAIAPSFVIKRVETRGVLDDERPLSTLGRDTTSSRARASIVLEGRTVSFAQGRSWELEAGQALVVSPLAGMYSRSLAPSILLELDWDAGGEECSGRLTLPAPLLGAARELARSLRDGDAPGVSLHGRAVFGGLRPLGLGPFDVEALQTVDGPRQRVVDAIDDLLTNLEGQPQIVDLETRLGCSRWTLARVIRDLSKTYGLFGVGGGTDWRSMRDFMRLRVAGIFMTHAQATTASVARAVGYGSAEAMCHAFAHAGLASPGRGCTVLSMAGRGRGS
jgi:AraC-like DNA-binding protein